MNAFSLKSSTLVSPKISADSLGINESIAKKAEVNTSQVAPISPEPKSDPDAIFDTKQKRVLELLSNGISAADVAGIVQLSPARISQMLTNPDFKSRLEELNMVKMNAYIGMDNSMDRIESKALENLERAMPMILDPMKLIKIVDTMNGLKRRTTNSTNKTNVAPSQVVVLNIGAQTLNKFVVNNQSEVIEVDGRPLLTMQSGQFRRFANETGNLICSEESSETGIPDAFAGSRQEG